MASDYDRREELKAFDDTKAGVKGLVEAGVTKVPRIFIKSPDVNGDQSSIISNGNHNKHFEIPVIDLEGIINMDEDGVKWKMIIEQVKQASETGGFFQVVNHGIPIQTMDEMIEGVRRFHEQPTEERSKYYTRETTRKVVYNSNFDLFQSPVANWRDSIICIMAPYPLHPEDLPIAFRDVVIEYSKHVMKLGLVLFELLSEALGLDRNHLNEIGCSEGLTVLGHYYPQCPEPELTLGTPRHSDNDFLTVLRQDDMGGLQVLHQNQWVDVPPVHGALVVNIGDLLQLISNDRFKSSEH